MNNLKPFNLERALAGDEVCLEDGTPVTQLHLFEAEGTPYSLVGVSNGMIISFTEDGRSLSCGPSRLFMKPKKRVVWVNLYGSSGAFYEYATEEEADTAATDQRFGGKVFKIEWEE